MNDVIVWGSLIIPIQLLLLIVSALTGFWALSYRLKGLNDTINSKMIPDILFNTLIVGLLIWKLSPLLYDAAFILQNPLSLLYFSGGIKGLVLAAFYTIGMLSYRTKKAKLPILIFPDAVLTILLAGGSMYALLLVVIKDGGLVSGLAALMSFVLYFLQLRYHIPLGNWKGITEIIIKRGNLITALVVIGMIGWIINGNLNIDASSSSNANTELDSAIGVRVGNKAMDFTLTMIDGHQVKLSDYRGKRVLLNFWATWCPPCKAEMPHMEKFYKEYQHEDIEVLGVNLTNTEKSADKAGVFALEHEITFPIALDPSGTVSNNYQVMAYPTSFIIDSDGIISDIYKGAISYDTMKQIFNNLP